MSITLRLPELRKDQWEIVKHPAKTKVICAGRRWGKTIMGGTLAITTAVQGAKVAWVVPTYRNARPLWRMVEQYTGQIKSIRRNKTDMLAEFPGGGFVGIYTADNDVSLRGESFDLVIVDEAARVAAETYTDVILPTLADRDGSCMLISTPKGHNWFWQEYATARTDGKRAMAWQAPTSANPMPTIRHAAELARTRVSARTYEQEWLAEFIADGGGVFRGVRACATAERQEQAIDGHEYVIGADWGRTNDATVFAVLDTTLGHLVALDIMRDTGYALQVGRLKGLAERFRPLQIMAETNSMGGPLVEQLQADNLPVYGFNTTNASKALIIDALALAFERQTIAVLLDETLLNELAAYESERLPGGMIRYNAPDGMHDDTVIATALAWHSGSAPTAGELFAFA